MNNCDSSFARDDRAAACLVGELGYHTRHPLGWPGSRTRPPVPPAFLTVLRASGLLEGRPTGAVPADKGYPDAGLLTPIRTRSAPAGLAESLQP